MDVVSLGESIKITLPTMVLFVTVVLLFIYLLAALFFPERFI